jgi:type III restriction enzyme
VEPVFLTAGEQQVAKATYDIIKSFERLPSSGELLHVDVQRQIVAQVRAATAPAQAELSGIAEQVDIDAVVAKTTELVVQQTIDIPRILVLPKGEVTSGFKPFVLDASSIHYQPVEQIGRESCMEIVLRLV